MPGAVVILALLAGVLSSCGPGGPTPADIARRLDAHVETIFAGVAGDDAAQLAADKQRVRDIHAIAALVEDYKKRSSRYPLVSTDGTLKNVIIAPGPPPYRDASIVEFDTFAGDLKAVLGAGIRIPFDPDGDTGGRKVYSYGVYGSGYTVAAYLHHHVVFSERVMGDTIQYRVGSSESVSLPIIEYAKFIAGTSAVPARKFSRQ